MGSRSESSLRDIFLLETAQNRDYVSRLRSPRSGPFPVSEKIRVVLELFDLVDRSYRNKS